MLVLGALLGIALFLFVKEYDLLSKVFFYSEETTENIEKKRFITNLLPVILGLPIILFLWVFRTHDTKEQLDKAQTNIEQQDFHDALRMLADDKLVSQEIAVLRLIDISKKNKICFLNLFLKSVLFSNLNFKSKPDKLDALKFTPEIL